MTSAKNGKIWWVVGGLATLFLASASAGVGYVVFANARCATNTHRIGVLEKKLDSMDKKLDTLLARPH